MSILGASVGRALEKRQTEQRRSELRRVSLEMLDDNELIDFKNNNTRNKIERALNDIKDVGELEEISKLISELTDNLNILIISNLLNEERKREIQQKAIMKIQNKIKKIEEKLGVRVVIRNNII
jgi:regulator of sigma D